MAFGKPDEKIQKGEFSKGLLISPLILLAITIILGFWIPNFLVQLLDQIVKNF
jgi:uncharacterized membrane protein YwzB